MRLQSKHRIASSLFLWRSISTVECGESTRFNTEPNSYTQYIWDLSPDGARIAILKASESLIRVLSWRDGSSKDVTVRNGNPLESLNWTADGQAFFASSYTKEGLVSCTLINRAVRTLFGSRKGVSHRGIRRPSLARHAHRALGRSFT